MSCWCGADCKDMKEDKSAVYDVAVIGGGVCGTALLYSLSQYTNVGRIALIEKNAEVALVNSKHTSNSQTLHFGDIETNYTLEKAKKVNKGASMVKAYLLKYDVCQDIYTKYHKMVLGVGKAQVEKLRDRYGVFSSLFPDLRLIEKEEIAQLEPSVLKGREDGEETLALFTSEGYTVDYRRLSQSFVKNATKDSDKHIKLMMETKVLSLEPVADEAGNESFIVCLSVVTIKQRRLRLLAARIACCLQSHWGMDWTTRC